MGVTKKRARATPELVAGEDRRLVVLNLDRGAFRVSIGASSGRREHLHDGGNLRERLGRRSVIACLGKRFFLILLVVPSACATPANVLPH